MSGSGEEKLLAVAGKWRDRGGGWLESELHGLASIPASPADQLSVTGWAAVQVHRLLRAPLPIRQIELDLEFGNSHLRVRHSPSLGSQLFGIKVPGTLTFVRDDGAHGQNVDVRINWDQLRNLAMHLVFAPPERDDDA